MNRLFLIFGLSALLAASCNDDFLERSPEDKVSDGAVWKTPEHLRLYVNNLYNRIDLLPSYGGYSDKVGIFSLDSDNGSDTQVGAYHNSRFNGEGIVTASNGWDVAGWEALRDINYFFANYRKASGDQSEINRYVGEALFFRAIFYYDKLRRFGDLPIYKGLLNLGDTEELYKKRDSRREVVEWLVDDLDTAALYLPPKKSSGNGRVNKETAMLLQARIALYEGTWEKYHALANTPFKVPDAYDNGEPFIRKAAAVTDRLIEMGTCTLDNVGVEDGYWKLFNQESYAASNEVLFWRQYADNIITHYWASYTSNGGGTGLTKSMVDAYLCIDGLPIDLSASYRGDSTLLSVVENRDPRLRQTIYVNDNRHFHFVAPNDTFFYPAFAISNEKNCVTGYQLYKGHNPNYERASTQRGITGLIYFRYAEALLINAEAKAELGTITQDDLDNTINQLRIRVGMSSPLNLAAVEAWSYAKEFPTLSNIINEVRRERKVELAAEGFRTDDIFRWAVAGDVIYRQRPRGAKRKQWENLPIEVRGSVLAIPIDNNGYIDPYRNILGSGDRDGYRFNRERDYLYPMPPTELVLNPALEQNPGWNN
ncbi:MAG: RagB/SusD family nutrient uptake outer membrane protein [Prevotellaceae bacterium]|jgi:hypothetical protein|nr:RagB/SusD family nutrient uptake outer membrane protein [Prevotellaceae bacterium]